MKKEEFEENRGVQDLKEIVLNKSLQNDIVDDIYKIKINEPINALSNEFCKYYNAVNIEDGNEYFAIVFEKYFNPNINLFEILKNNYIENINKLVTYSIVKLSYSKACKLVAIIEKYEIKNNLYDYVKKNGPLPLELIKYKLIPCIVKLLEFCENYGISCGNINPYNIIIEDNDNFSLKEFISAYSGFYQINHYLAPEITECIEAGRFVKGIDADIYALGITIFYCLTGKEPWEEYESIDKYNEARFEQSTPGLLLTRRKLPEDLKLFLKGTLHDDLQVRWKYKNINEWLAGKVLRITSIDRFTSNNYSIAFNGQNYSTLKAISYALFRYWEEAVSFIFEDKLPKWIVRNNYNSDLIESVYSLIGKEKVDKTYIVLHNINRNEKLTKLLSLIDPNGSIRHRELAFTAFSIPDLMHYSIIRNKRDKAEQIIKTIKEKYCKVEEDNSNTVGTINKTTAAFYEKIIENFSSFSSTLGFERIIYSLNKYAPCLSQVLEDEYVVSVRDLLLALDRIALKNPEKFFIDKHIIAFICAKLSLQDDKEIKILTKFPKFCDHPSIYGLSILNIAQQDEPDLKIPNLCRVLTARVIEVLNDNLYNNNFKIEISNKLTEAAAEGKLFNIVTILSDQKSFIDDYNGYYQASRQIQNLNRQMKVLNVEEKLYENSLLLGQKVTVLISYIFCLIVTVILIM